MINDDFSQDNTSYENMNNFKWDFFCNFLCNLKTSKVENFLQNVCTFSPLNILNIGVIEAKKLQEEICYKNFFFTAFKLRKIKAEKK